MRAATKPANKEIVSPTRPQRKRAGSSREASRPYRQRDWRITTGAGATGTRGGARPHSWNSVATNKRARSAQSCCGLHISRQRTATTGAATPSTAAIGSGWALPLRRRRPWGLQNDRQFCGKLRQPLGQRGKNFALPVGARATPFADLGERASAAGAILRARIEGADFDARRLRKVDH